MHLALNQHNPRTITTKDIAVPHLCVHMHAITVISRLLPVVYCLLAVKYAWAVGEVIRIAPFVSEIILLKFGSQTCSIGVSFDVSSLIHR